MDELMDMITKDESPSGISDAIKDALYARSADKINDHKNSVANALFSSPEDEEQLQKDVEGYADTIAGLGKEEEGEEEEIESEPEGEE
tara:strand:- start:590 stop:853 length:264 start_codon:yes stop_codon:yes gene_type:complete